MTIKFNINIEFTADSDKAEQLVAAISKLATGGSPHPFEAPPDRAVYDHVTRTIQSAQPLTPPEPASIEVPPASDPPPAAVVDSSDVAPPSAPKSTPPTPASQPVAAPSSAADIRTMKIVDLRDLAEAHGIARKTPRKEMEEQLVQKLFGSPAASPPKQATPPAPPSELDFEDDPQPQLPFDPSPQDDPDDLDAIFGTAPAPTSAKTFEVPPEAFTNPTMVKALEQVINSLHAQAATVDEATQFVVDNLSKFTSIPANRQLSESSVRNAVASLYARAAKA